MIGSINCVNNNVMTQTKEKPVQVTCHTIPMPLETALKHDYKIDKPNEVITKLDGKLSVLSHVMSEQHEAIDHVIDKLADIKPELVSDIIEELTRISKALGNEC